MLENLKTTLLVNLVNKSYALKAVQRALSDKKELLSSDSQQIDLTALPSSRNLTTEYPLTKSQKTTQNFSNPIAAMAGEEKDEFSSTWKRLSKNS